MEENFCADCRYYQNIEGEEPYCWNESVVKYHWQDKLFIPYRCRIVRKGKPCCELFEQSKSIWRKIYERLNSLAND